MYLQRGTYPAAGHSEPSSYMSEEGEACPRSRREPNLVPARRQARLAWLRKSTRGSSSRGEQTKSEQHTVRSKYDSTKSSSGLLVVGVVEKERGTKRLKEKRFHICNSHK